MVEQATTTEQMLRELAAQLGTTTEYLWSALVRMAVYEAAFELVWIALLAAWTYWGLLPMFRRWNDMPPGDDYSLMSMKQVGVLVLAIVTTVFWCVKLSNLYLIAGLWDPEAVTAIYLINRLL